MCSHRRRKIPRLHQAHLRLEPGRGDGALTDGVEHCIPRQPGFATECQCFGQALRCDDHDRVDHELEVAREFAIAEVDLFLAEGLDHGLYTVPRGLGPRHEHGDVARPCGDGIAGDRHAQVGDTAPCCFVADLGRDFRRYRAGVDEDRARSDSGEHPIGSESDFAQGIIVGDRGEDDVGFARARCYGRGFARTLRDQLVATCRAARIHQHRIARLQDKTGHRHAHAAGTDPADDARRSHHSSRYKCLSVPPIRTGGHRGRRGNLQFSAISTASCSIIFASMTGKSTYWTL